MSVTPDLSRLPSFAVQALHLVTLTATALTARLYATLGNQPKFFTARQAGGADLLLFVLVLSAALPGLLVGLLWGLGRLGKRVAVVAFLILIALLLVAVALPLCKQLVFLPDPVIAALAVALGIAATVVYGRVSRLRVIVTVLAPIALISPAIYLFASPTAQLLFHRSAAATAAVRPGNPAPVVVVVFDELSGTTLVDGAGRIDTVLYPNFAALANEATWFRNASSVAAETEAALPGILTGNLPRAGVHEMDVREYPHNLFTLLRESHKFSAFEPCTTFCPDELRTEPVPASLGMRLKSLLIDAAVLDAIQILPRHWPLALPDVSGRYCNFAGAADSEEPDLYYGRRETLERFTARIQDRPGAKPGLFFIHSVLPHSPWVYLPSGKQYNLEGLPPQIRDSNEFTLGVAGLDREAKRWLDDDVVVAQAQQRYLLQVQFVDRELGRLFRHLKEVGLYDRSLIVVTADHGVSFVPGQPFRGICREIYPETLSVPLFIKLPGQHAGRASDRNVEAVDILPTMVAVLKVRLPWPTRGSSALDDGVPERPGREACITLQPRASWEGDNWHDWLPGKDQAVRRRLERFAASNSPRSSREGQGVREICSPLPPGEGGHHVPMDGVRASDALSRFGPYRGMIGRSVAECRVAAGSGEHCELYRPERLAQVDLQDDCLPLLIGGRVSVPGDHARGVDLAVAVNGTVRAVARTFPVPGYGDAWTALLPEDALRQGANEIKLYKLSGCGAGVELVPLEERTPASLRSVDLSAPAGLAPAERRIGN